ncbi:hypothetical protein [Phytomonospora endophytica]|uniref:Uncharacterized protein n=1 Tax=Phytomonospora endophytica TaxID=714109 RepID=A0A841FPG3_9ACTN|nr:hypothetical protein [Phytomonospora endophytica]MBB6035137.1 hypothetical protein [Phytomonospora endophytica]GIG64113.1 hypothetical protein Pen01_04080 [Phytomonospora endophytica]
MRKLWSSFRTFIAKIPRISWLVLGTVVAVGPVVRYVTTAAIDPAMAASILGGFATITVAALTVALGRYVERMKQIEAEQHQRRAEMHSEFIAEFVRGLGLDQAPSVRKPVGEAQLAQTMANFTASALAWSTPVVLQAVRQWRKDSNQLSTEAQSDPAFVFGSVERLIRAIRVELGHSDKGLKDYDLVGLFVNDLDSFLTKRGIKT